jgi:TRAP-type uncharacterized transport system substrate-binding protein
VAERRPPLSATAIRSKLMLEVANAFVSAPDQKLRQVKVLIREQGTADWPLALYASNTTAGIEAVVAGEATMAMINPSAALTLAYRGKGPYGEAQPVRAIAIIPSEDQYLFAVRKDLGLTRLEEIASRRLTLRIGVRGSRDHYLHVMLDHVAQAAGFTVSDFEKWGGRLITESTGPPRADSPKLSAVRANELDAVFDEGAALWLGAALEAGMTLLSLDETTVGQLETMGYRRAVVRCLEYPLLGRDILTVDFSGWAIFVHAAAPDAIVQRLCAALEERKASIPWEGDGPLPLERMCSDSPETPLGVPLHPAAERFWRSQGYLE